MCYIKFTHITVFSATERKQLNISSMFQFVAGTNVFCKAKLFLEYLPC